MKSRRNRMLLISAIVMGSLAVCLAAYAGLSAILPLFSFNERAKQDPKAQASMLECTLEWARLATIPEFKEQFAIATEGGPATRAFRASFLLPESDLKGWVEASPGLKDAGLAMEGVKQYAIEPGSGAMYAEAVIDFDTGLVKVYTYWS